MVTSSQPLRVLIVGANYGLILAVKFALAGHRVTMVGHPQECKAINLNGAEIRYPTGKTLSAKDNISAYSPLDIDPDEHDIAFLAIQEPQVAQPEIAQLVIRLGGRLPIACLMNLPPESFLRRLEGFEPALWKDVHAAAEVWSQIPSDNFTCASPDPQAYRADPNALNKLQISHVANFKFAPFEMDKSQSILMQLSRDAGKVRFSSGGRAPIHLVRTRSIFAPLTKWPMLATGNCRCIQDGRPPISIQSAVNDDLEESRALYECVNTALAARGVPEGDLVPFEDYVKASQNLNRPSSLALALEKGVPRVERVDVLIDNLLSFTKAPEQGRRLMSETKTLIQTHLDENCSKRREELFKVHC